MIDVVQGSSVKVRRVKCLYAEGRAFLFQIACDVKRPEVILSSAGPGSNEVWIYDSEKEPNLEPTKVIFNIKLPNKKMFVDRNGSSIMVSFFSVGINDYNHNFGPGLEWRSEKV